MPHKYYVLKCLFQKYMISTEEGCELTIVFFKDVKERTLIKEPKPTKEDNVLIHNHRKTLRLCIHIKSWIFFRSI